MGCCESEGNQKSVNIPLEQMNKVSKSVCKINIKKNENATGFFLDIYPYMKCLVTNYHVISQDMVNANSVIEIENDLGEKIRLKLNSNERYIKCFEKPTDVTVIQIKNSDGINKYFQFLEYDPYYKKENLNNNYVSIFTLQHRLGKKLEAASGRILKNIDVGYSFAHNIDTDVGASGSPIILLSNAKVIGIHKAGSLERKENYATYLEKIIEEIKKDFKQGIPINIQENNPIKINKPNRIVAILVVIQDNVNKDLPIINSFENSRRTSILNQYNLINSFSDERYNNEEDIKQCEIKVDGEKIDFSYTLRFPKPGQHIITYSFKKKLKRCNCLFYKCPNLININLSNFDSEEVTDMSFMFYLCKYLFEVNLSNLNTKKLTNIMGMFGFCHFIKIIDFSDFDTSNVTDMKSLFFFCFELEKIKFSSKFNTRNVVDMNMMFIGCKSLKNLDLSNFNTQNVTNMSLMFSVCSSLKNLDLSNFNTQNVTNMSQMFEACSSLTHLNLLNFNAQNVTNINNMFKNCDSLINENLICYDEKILNEFYNQL